MKELFPSCTDLAVPVVIFHVAQRHSMLSGTERVQEEDGCCWPTAAVIAESRPPIRDKYCAPPPSQRVSIHTSVRS